MTRRDDPVAWENLKSLNITKNAGGTFLNTLGGVQDEVSGAQVSIDYGHHELHEGHHYQVECYQTLGSAGTVAFCLTTPITKQPHMLFSIQATGATEFNAYKLGSFGADGTSETPFNNNHNSSGTAETVVSRDATIAALGTRFTCKAFGVAGSPVKATGGDIRAENEVILKAGTSAYIYHIKSNSDDNVISYHGNWYEHTPTIT